MTLGQVHYPTNGNKRRALTTPARLSSSIFFFLGLSSETFSNYLFQSTPREALVQDSNTKIKRTCRVRAQTALHFHLSERQKLTTRLSRVLRALRRCSSRSSIRKVCAEPGEDGISRMEAMRIAFGSSSYRKRPNASV